MSVDVDAARLIRLARHDEIPVPPAVEGADELDAFGVDGRQGRRGGFDGERVEIDVDPERRIVVASGNLHIGEVRVALERLGNLARLRHRNQGVLLPHRQHHGHGEAVRMRQHGTFPVEFRLLLRRPAVGLRRDPGEFLEDGVRTAAGETEARENVAHPHGDDASDLLGMHHGIGHRARRPARPAQQQIAPTPERFRAVVEQIGQIPRGRRAHVGGVSHVDGEQRVAARPDARQPEVPDVLPGVDLVGVRERPVQIDDRALVRRARREQRPVGAAVVRAAVFDPDGSRRIQGGVLNRRDGQNHEDETFGDWHRDLLIRVRTLP